jgi:hypothetical protein
MIFMKFSIKFLKFLSLKKLILTIIWRPLIWYNFLIIFSSDHDSWEPAENLPKGKIAAFNKNQEQSSDEEEYVVENIVEEKTRYGKTLYCVKWEGYKSK